MPIAIGLIAVALAAALLVLQTLGEKKLCLFEVISFAEQTIWILAFHYYIDDSRRKIDKKQ